MGNDIDARVAAAHQKYTAKKEAANKSGGSSNIDARVDAAYQQYTEKKQREAAHRLYQDQNGGSSGNPWGNPFYDSIYKSQEKRKLDFYTLYREFDRLSSFEQDADTFYGSWHSQEEMEKYRKKLGIEAAEEKLEDMKKRYGGKEIKEAEDYLTQFREIVDQREGYWGQFGSQEEHDEYQRQQGLWLNQKDLLEEQRGKLEYHTGSGGLSASEIEQRASALQDEIGKIDSQLERNANAGAYLGMAMSNEEKRSLIVRRAELAEELVKTMEMGNHRDDEILEQRLRNAAMETVALRGLLGDGYVDNPYNTRDIESASAYSESASRQKKLNREQEELDYFKKYDGKTYKDNFLGQWGGNYTLGRLSQDSSMAWSDYLSSPTEENRKKAETIDQLITQFQRDNGETLADDGTLPILSKTLANYLPQLFDQVKYEAAGGLIALPADLALNTLGINTNGKLTKAGVTAGSGMYSYKNMQGAAFKSLLEAGVDEETARKAANDEALISSLIEMADTAVDLFTTGSGKVIDLLSAGSADALKKQIVKAAGKNTFTKLAVALGKYGINILGEGLEEGTQESVSIANQNNPGAGKWQLTKEAAAVFWDAITNEDSENREQVLTAMKEGEKLAALLGSAEMAASEVTSRAVGSYRANQVYGLDAKALVQEGLELNPDSALAKKMNTRLEAGKKVSGWDLARLVQENEDTITGQDVEIIQSGVQERLKTLGETGNVETVSQAVARTVTGETLTKDQKAALKGSKYGQRVLNELKPENIASGDYSTNWAKELETNRVNSEAYTGGTQRKADIPGNKAGQTVENLEGKAVDAAVSEDGKTRIVSTGQDTEIQKIASIRDGNITFQMEDGSLVDAGDIAYGSEGEAIIYDAVASLGVGPEMANVLADGFTTSRGVPAAVYAKGMQDAFWYGKWGAPMQEMESGVYTSQLTELQRQNAYQVGRMMAQEEASAKQEQRKQEAALKKGQKQPGKVHFEGDTEKLTKKQKTNMQALETIADALGIQIYVFESETATSPDGKGTVRIGDNGWYIPEDGSIHIDLYAGADGKGTMLFTAAHELTHFIKDQSPEKFQALSDFLMEQYGKNGVPVQALVEQQMAKARKHGKELDYDGAFEEVVADSMESMLTDGKVLQELKRQDKGLWQTVKDYVLELCEKIRKVYKGLKPDSLEGRMVAEMRDAAEEMRRLFTEGLVDAGENFQGAEKNPTTEGGAKYQARRLSDEDLQEYLLAGGRTNKKKIEASNSGGKIILTSQKEIVDYIDKAIDKQLDNNITVAYGKVNDRLANEVLSESNGKIRIKDSFLELIPDNLQHAYEQHSSAKKEGDIDLSREDFERIPEYLDSFTEVVYAITYSSGKTSVCVSKKLPNGRMLLIEVVSKSRGALQFKNAIGVSEEKYQKDYLDVYKKRAESNTRGSKRSNNSLRDDISSNNSIFSPDENVKQKFSIRDQDVRKMNDVLEKQNEKLREDVASLKELLKLQKSVTGGKLLNQNSLDTAAGYLMRSSGAKGNKAELSGLLKDVYSYIAGDEAVTWDGIMEKAQPAADWLSEHMETKRQPDPYGAEVLSQLRGSRIYLDESQRAEAEYQFGSVNALRKQLFGTVTITDKDAVSLDSKWAELSQMYPDVFDPNTSAADMPGALLDAIDSLKNMGIGEMWYDKEAARQDLLQQIYDGYWRVSTLHTVADVKQKQIDRLKGEHIARLNKIKAQNKENIQKLKSEHRADMKTLREDMRKSSLEKQEIIRKQYQDSRAKSVEGRHRTEMRHKVQRVVKDLNDLLLNGTKEKHVPIELQKAAAEALDAVNMDTVGAEERIARLEDALTKTKDPKKMQEISRKIENIQKMGSSMQEKLQRLKAGYDAIMQSEDPLIANAYSPEIAGQLMTLTVTAGDTPLRDMSLKQLEAVYNAYTMVLTTIRNANKTFKAARNATVQELSQKVMTEVSGAGGKRQYGLPAMEAIRKFGWNNLKPVYAFELMGSKTFSDIFKNVRKGEDIWAVDVNEARDFYLEQVKKYGYNQWDMGKQYEFTSATGETFRLGLPQIMSLYAYSKREQAADHLRKGGIVIDESTEVSVKTKLGITMKFNPTEATAYNISDETLTDIVGTLTKEQKAYVDAMQEYLSTVMGEKGNEVSLQMYGIKLFGEKHYFPLRSAQQYLARAKEQQQGDRKIKNAGFSKQTVAHAGNPVVLSGFMDVWAEHVNEMSMYHAFVLPMEDFYRVFNYNTGNVEKEESRSVNAAIQNAYGSAATKYIDQLLKDLNGGARADPTTGIISKGMNLFKKGAVFASASVVIQQPSAIGRALSMIDMKYFAGPRITKENHKDSWNQLKKYAPVAAIKEMGYFDTNMGKSTKDYILGQEYEGFGEKAKAFFTDSGYRDEALSRGAALADEITWCNIWEAVKRETKAKHPDLSVRSETFLQMAGERFTDVIVKTQVYDSVLSRSGNMRSKDTGMKMATAFMAEPTTSMNMIVDALVQGKRNGAEGRRHCRRAIGAVVAAQVINSILVSFVYAARDDDEDETYLEKYVEALTSGLLDSLNPATYIPFLKDIVSIFQGYDVERSDMAVVSDLWKAYKRLGSKKLNPWRKVEEFAGSLCQIFGVPLKNIMRDARGLYQMVNTLMGPEKTTLAGLKYAVQAGSGKEVSLYEQMYQAYILGDQEHLNRVEDRYMRNSDAPNERRAEKELQSGFQSFMKNQFLDEEVTEQEVRDILHGYLEMDMEDVDAALNQWKGELETGKTESNMEDAYLRKEISGEEYMDYLQTYSGKSQEQAEKAELKLRCERDEGIAYSEIKELYMDGELSGDRASILMADYDKDTSKADAKEKILEWDFESAYGIAYSDRKRAFLDGEISETDLLTGLQKYGGYDKEDAEEYVEKLVFEDKHGFAYSEKKSAYLNGEVSRSVLKNILIQEMEYSEENAELTMQAYDWQKAHPESKYDTTSIKSYLKPMEDLDYSAKECGIPVDTFVKGKAYVGTLHGEKNSKGKWIPNSRINKAFPYIDNLPLSPEQKTAFAVACGWSLKTVKKNKLW